MKSIKIYNKEYNLKLALYAQYDFMGVKKPGIAIRLFEPDDEYEDCGLLTVSFGEYIGLLNAAYIDTNNCVGAEKELLKHSGVLDTGCTKRSGFCEYPCFVFSQDFLRDIDDDGCYNEYLEGYRTEMHITKEDLKKQLKKAEELFKK